MEVIPNISMYKFQLGIEKLLRIFRMVEQFNLETTIVAPSQMNIPVDTPETFILEPKHPRHSPFNGSKPDSPVGGDSRKK